MLALIDGDICVYRVGFTTEDLDLGIALYRMDTMLHRILEDVEATEYKLFLSDSTENGFRVRYLPEYKANRVAPKPRWYEELKEHVITKWGARIRVGEEADDGLGICSGSETICCSIDKDLFQIPGRHYNFVKSSYREVKSFEGEIYFYSQLLTGDRADNISGIYGIGPLKAGKILEDAASEQELFLATVEAYRKWLKKEWCKGGEVWDEFKEHQMLNMILIKGICLKIRQEEEKIWNFPEGTISSPLVAGQLLSTQQEQVDSTQSTELIGME